MTNPLARSARQQPNPEKRKNNTSDDDDDDDDDDEFITAPAARPSWGLTTAVCVRFCGWRA